MPTVAWASLSTRLAGLPTVLAGPILRTATKTSVTVWLALKEATTVTLDICASDAATAPALMSGSAPATKIGPNLYIVAVTATSQSAQLTPATIYFYRLTFATASGSSNLVQATNAQSPAAFAYAPYQAPSFTLPPTAIEQVRFSLGSCRKPHWNDPDALALLDDLLAADPSTPAQRQQFLLMAGDQIYADEVADSLLLMLTDAGTALIGSEELPLGSTSTSPTLYPPTTRSKLITSAGFTTDDTRSHLMGLGEYLAMYLFAWSDTLWPAPADVPTSKDVIAAAAPASSYLLADAFTFETEQQRTSLLATLVTLPKVRRALANIPTYMILDDHEITDDWNMQRKFCDAVYSSPLGMRIIQNGLVAYALCQHWGNCPSQFIGTGAGATLLQWFATATNGYGTVGDNPALPALVGLHPPALLVVRTPYSLFHDAQSLIYNYTIEGDAFQLVVTDTRTWRAFPRPGQISPPDLIQEPQLAVQIGATPALGDRLLIVVVTTNMPPCPSLRQAARDVPSLPHFIHNGDNDDFFDAWQIEQIDFARMLKALAAKLPAPPARFAGRVVVLSGDVHSSQVSRLAYTATQQVDDATGAPTPASVVFAQLVASAFHNGSADTRGEHLAGYNYAPASAQRFAQPALLTENFVGWNPTTTPDKTTLGSYVYTHLVPLDVSTVPLLFNSDRPTVTTRFQSQGSLWTKDVPQLTMTPHYRYRLDYLNRAATSNMATGTPVSTSTTGVAMLAMAAQAYHDAVAAGGIQQVGYSNICEVTFASGSNPNAPPDLLAQLKVRTGPSNDVQWVRFDVSLDPKDTAFTVPSP